MRTFLKRVRKKVLRSLSNKKGDYNKLLLSAETEDLSLKRLQLASRIANIGIWDYLIPENRLIWDDNMFRLYGIDHDMVSITPDVVLASVHPDDRKHVREVGFSALAGGRDYETDFRIIKPDGSIRWIKSVCQLSRDAEGHPIRVVGLNYDISQLKQTEASLIQLKRLYATLSVVNQAIVRIRDRQELFSTICNLVVEYGEFGAAWIGEYDPDSENVNVIASVGPMMDQWPFPNINLKHGEFSKGPVVEAIHTGKVALGEGIHSFAAVPFQLYGMINGVLCLLTKEPGFFSQKEEVDLLEKLGVDISFALDIIHQEQVKLDEFNERKRMEDALRESETKYRLISENAGDVIWVMDPGEGKFTYVSPSVFKLRGYTAEEVMANPVSDSLTSESLQLVNSLLMQNMEAFNQTGSQTMTFVTQVDQPCKDGSIVPTEVTTTAFFNPQGRLEIIGVSRNIRERVKIEEEVRKLNAELENRVTKRTAQLEEANYELEAFTYSVSHDLRAPLRAITGFSTILKLEYQDRLDEEGNRLCEVIASSAIRLGRLIDDLLAFSRLGRSEIFPGLINMSQIVASVFEELTQPEDRTRITLKVDDLPETPADPAMIKQVWANLISNAIKYTGRQEQAVIEISCRTEEGTHIYCIRDNGIGFDMKYAGQLFGVFQRLHSNFEFEGTGVGLAIVQRIIQKHGGKIWAEGKPGEGAAFWFSLPAGIS